MIFRDVEDVVPYNISFVRDVEDVVPYNICHFPSHIGEFLSVLQHKRRRPTTVPLNPVGVDVPDDPCIVPGVHSPHPVGVDVPDDPCIVPGVPSPHPVGVDVPDDPCIVPTSLPHQFNLVTTPQGVVINRRNFFQKKLQKGDFTL